MAAIHFKKRQAGAANRHAITAVMLLLVALSILLIVTGRFPLPAWVTGTTYAAVTVNCPGDVNFDGQRDILDLVLIQAHVEGKQLLTGDAVAAADVNGDDRVDVLDVFRMLQHTSKKKPLPDCGSTMTVSPAALDFGGVTVGQGRDLTVTIANIGSASLTVTSVASSNPRFAAGVSEIPFNIAAGSQQNVTVRFTPAAAGTQTGTLSISAASEGFSMSSNVSLSGTGIVSNNPVPTVTSITPSSATAGDAGLTVTLIGTNFVSTSVVLWDGVAKPTTFVSPTQLTASIAASDLAADNTIAVAVSNPAPGGGISGAKVFYIAPKTAPPLSTVNIRFISPNKAKVGTQFTILGNNFDPTPSKNTVIFNDTGDTPAPIISGTTNSIVATVPAGLIAGKKYSVMVAANGNTSNPVAFEITTAASPLEIKPRTDVFLLMPPGNGKKNLMIGGGTLPYKLKPLSTEDQAKARAELKGNIIEVTGIDAGKLGVTSVSIEVSDSASPAATASVSVRVQQPTFDPQFDVFPHNLLPGSAPSFDFTISTSYGQMTVDKSKIRLDSLTADLSKIQPGSRVGYIDADGTFGFAQAADVLGPTQLGTRIYMQGPRDVDDVQKGRQTIAVTATGSLVSASGSLTINQASSPEALPQSVVTSGVTTKTTLFDGIIRLPSTPDTTFIITATFTSPTVFEGKYLPMTKVVTKTFKTVAPPAAGAPQITRVAPDQGEVGRVVTIEGSGFSATPGENIVTFPAAQFGQRVQAEVTSAGPNKLVVSVPRDAADAYNDYSLQVKVNNKTSTLHSFRTLFTPDGWLMLPDLKGGAAVGPLIFLGQGQDSVKIASAQIRLDLGSMTASGLTKDKPAGTVLWTQFGATDTLDLVYRGQETTGARRHIFDIQEQGTFPSRRAQLFMSPGTNGAGAVFDFAFVQNYDLLNKSLLIQFDTPVYVLPGSGTNIPTVVEFTSRQWMYLPTSLMKVRFPLTFTTTP